MPKIVNSHKESWNHIGFNIFYWNHKDNYRYINYIKSKETSCWSVVTRLSKVLYHKVESLYDFLNKMHQYYMSAKFARLCYVMSYIWMSQLRNLVSILKSSIILGLKQGVTIPKLIMKYYEFGPCFVLLHGLQPW